MQTSKWIERTNCMQWTAQWWQLKRGVVVTLEGATPSPWGSPKTIGFPQWLNPYRPYHRHWRNGLPDTTAQPNNPYWPTGWCDCLKITRGRSVTPLESIDAELTSELAAASNPLLQSHMLTIWFILSPYLKCKIFLICSKSNCSKFYQISTVSWSVDRNPSQSPDKSNRS